MNANLEAALVLYWLVSSVVASLGFLYWSVGRELDELDFTLTWGKLILLIVLLPGWVTVALSLLLGTILIGMWRFLDKPIFKE